MDDEIGVFDSWGNFLGRFIPAGGGGSGCFFAILLVILAITIGLPILLLVKGIDFWRKGRQEIALVCWLGLAVIIAIPTIIYANNRAQQAAYSESWARQEAEKQGEQFQLFYSVQKGDTLEKIAAHFNVSVESIAKLNPNTENVFLWGGQLIIPKPKAGQLQQSTAVSPTPRATPTKSVEQQTAVPIPRAATIVKPAPGATPIVYVVQMGDTLGKIAAQYKVSVESIAKLNNIQNPDLIAVGQRLTIPTPSP